MKREKFVPLSKNYSQCYKASISYSIASQNDRESMEITVIGLVVERSNARRRSAKRLLRWQTAGCGEVLENISKTTEDDARWKNRLIKDIIICVSKTQQKRNKVVWCAQETSHGRIQLVSIYVNTRGCSKTSDNKKRQKIKMIRIWMTIFLWRLVSSVFLAWRRDGSRSGPKFHFHLSNERLKKKAE